MSAIRSGSCRRVEKRSPECSPAPRDRQRRGPNPHHGLLESPLATRMVLGPRDMEDVIRLPTGVRRMGAWQLRGKNTEVNSHGRGVANSCWTIEAVPDEACRDAWCNRTRASGYTRCGPKSFLRSLVHSVGGRCRDVLGLSSQARVVHACCDRSGVARARFVEARCRNRLGTTWGVDRRAITISSA
jgi:hypothetical protein